MLKIDENQIMVYLKTKFLSDFNLKQFVKSIFL